MPCNRQCQRGNAEDIPILQLMQKDQSQYLSKQQGMKNWEHMSFEVFAAGESVLGHDTVLWSVLAFEKSILHSSPLRTYWPLVSNYPVA